MEGTNAQRPGGPEMGDARVLIVEDDPDIRRLLTYAARGVGLQVSTTGRGQEGLRLAREEDPELVLLDLTLPDLDGLEVCRALRRFSDAYIVMCTARTQEADRLTGLDVGADDYLIKPFSVRELRARLAALMRRPRRLLTGHPPVTGAEHGTQRLGS